MLAKNNGESPAVLHLFTSALKINISFASSMFPVEKKSKLSYEKQKAA